MTIFKGGVIKLQTFLRLKTTEWYFQRCLIGFNIS